MSAFDPIVADVLDRFAPVVEDDPEAMLRGAAARARSLRASQARRTRRILVVAFAGLLVVAGGAVAASKLDLLPWFENNASEAAFSVDSSRRYTGPAPLALVCPEAGGGEFACSEGTLPPHGTRRYLFAERVEAGPHVNRAFYVDAIEQAEREGRLSPSDASRLRRDLAAVGDDFFAGLSLLTGIRTVGTGENRVPPPGVPLWIACRADGAMFSCHDLAHSRDVPVGTPLYLLKESSDWRTQPRPLTAPVDVAALFHAVLGRQLRPAEARFLFDLATIGSGGAESHAGPVRTQPIP